MTFRTKMLNEWMKTPLSWDTSKDEEYALGRRNDRYRRLKESRQRQ
ncbi:MAG: hypothetical protein ACLUKN_14895 [Bacilli bacterium]